MAPFRRRFEELGISKQELARRLGWMRPNGERAARALGIYRTHRGGGWNGFRQHVDYETAEQLAEALNLDPWEAGL